MTTLYMEQWLRLLGGIMVFGSVLLAVFHSSQWLWLTGLMGVNLTVHAPPAGRRSEGAGDAVARGNAGAELGAGRT
ncbi:MAG: hypothetical protein A3I14_17225 [Candidatus Rokubacteria bacterium RIFCSPLOWO2_02_FULL_73_56]|nr:MAG: hypothetical protein A3I14_17225 [Candidatus Rokubacteria bacterium RIFCSPLOWO2_02_FULL_73_56]OGL27512.1 MAG: hypothetical protein A3G44_05540 [Candidatus Rokubacteria bacterium RIFCSPLOWO2_12_FULL_73_47]